MEFPMSVPVLLFLVIPSWLYAALMIVMVICAGWLRRQGHPLNQLGEWTITFVVINWFAVVFPFMVFGGADFTLWVCANIAFGIILALIYFLVVDYHDHRTTNSH